MSARAAAAKRERRRGDPELRAREAERKRKRRQADPELRAREAELKRQRRAVDLEAARQREAESKRKRRAADPEAARQREAESKRKRRAADPEAVRQREAAMKRKRRATDPEATRQRESAAKATKRSNQLLGTDGASARFKRDFLDRSFGHSCSVCDRLWFDNNLTKVGSIQNEQHRNAVIGVLRQEFGPANHGEFMVCSTCKEALTSGKDREKEPASRCTREILAKPVQTEASWLFNSSVVDVAVETSRSVDVCKSTQTSLVVVKVHRWTETTDLVESQDSDTDVQEYPAPHVCGMPRLTNMDQSAGVATLYSHQVDVCDDTFMDCSSGPAAAQTLYDGSCIVRWCTNTSPGRLFRVPKDNRMEAFLKYAERPHLLGLPKEIVHHYRICSAHFMESDYMDPAKSKLKWLAVPSIKAPEGSNAPQVCGMPRLTNMDQSPGVATLYSHQVDGQSDGSSVDCSSGPAAVQLPYFGSCIVRWCTNTSPGRLFRVPKDNRMEAFLKYAERPHLLGLPKEIVHHYRMCSAHFTESDYMDPAKTKLKWLAVPSIKAPEGSNGDTASPRHLREPSPQPGPSGL